MSELKKKAKWKAWAVIDRRYYYRPVVCESKTLANDIRRKWGKIRDGIFEVVRVEITEIQ